MQTQLFGLGKIKVIVLMVVTVVLCGWIGLSTFIGYQVGQVCLQAVELYSGQCTTALTKMVDEPALAFRQRNQAIWALGQLGATQALPVLERYSTNQVPAQESPDTALSQEELQKAIAQIKSGRNIAAVWWQIN